jgi:hypothetical protein
MKKPIVNKKRKSDLYKYVYCVEFYNHGKPQKKWQVHLPKYNFYNFFDSEKEAARAVDLKLIGMNKKPINILKSV